MDADAATGAERLGWARILAIAVAASVVGFAFFHLAYTGLRGTSTAGTGTSALVQAAPWGSLLLALSLCIVPAAVAVMTWVGARRPYVWVALAAYAAQVVALDPRSPHLAFGVLPLLAAAVLYTLPRRRPAARPAVSG
ncbi:MAG TPA: hypothetical protein VFH47_08400 [Candidatus Thermoplasmatota archaeon]|nr:hypothetical protein [Candidatus Thermoplasmatota archaeon]